MMWWWGGENMGAAGWVGMAFMILFWIAVVVGIVYLIRYLVSRPPTDRWREPPPEWRAPGAWGEQGKSDALHTLEERYAKGEIDQDEFIRRRDDIAGKSG